MFTWWRRRQAKNALIYAAMDFYRAELNDHGDKDAALAQLADAASGYLETAPAGAIAFWTNRATEKDHEKNGRKIHPETIHVVGRTQREYLPPVAARFEEVVSQSCPGGSKVSP